LETNSTVVIKEAQQTDLAKIAACHMHAFPESVTTLLGKTVVADMFKWYLSAQNKFLVWIEEGEECIGYCGGVVMDGSDAFGSASGMTQFGMQAGMKRLLLKPWLLFHPEIRKRLPFIVTNLKRKLKRLFKKNQPKPIVVKQPTDEIKSGLVVIGVHPKQHGKGLGSLLQQAFEEKSKVMGAGKMELSVRKNNQKAIRSYERNGWQITGSEGPSYLMAKTILN
jgi:ribosomal protein S18 acetylase RimI-like enzyme